MRVVRSQCGVTMRPQPAAARLYAARMRRAPAALLLSMVVGVAALAPSASAAQINPAVQLQALSCASSGNCGAVGGYDDGLGNSQALLVTESAGKWQHAVEAQAPRGRRGGSVQGLRRRRAWLASPVRPPAIAAAVGRYTDADRADHGVLFSETHGRWWRGVRLQLPANAIASPRPKSGVIDVLGLAAISCSSVGNCVAVGNYESNAEVWEAMIVVEHQGHWTRAVEAPLPAGAPIAGPERGAAVSVTCSRSGHSARPPASTSTRPAISRPARQRHAATAGPPPRRRRRRATPTRIPT